MKRESRVACGSDGEPLSDPQWRAPADRLGRVVAGHLRVTYLYPLPFWLKMTKRFMQELEKLCSRLPYLSTKPCLNLCSKRSCPSRLRFGVLKLVERLVSALRQTGGCSGNKVSIEASGNEISRCIETKDERG